MAIASSAGPGPEDKETTSQHTRPLAQAGLVLESDVPLSQSLIWRRQREFYARRGLKAWSEDRVPEYITNNPFIAEIYARIVAEFLGECMAAGLREHSVSVQRPLRVIELGAGSGKFSYLFLRYLAALLHDRDIPLAAVRYLMTDCSESILAAWRNNSYLAEFVAAGNLEFAVFQATEEGKPGVGGDSAFGPSATGPLVVIANYVFDSLPQDAFVVAAKDGEGQIFEALITTTAPSPDSRQASGGALSTLQLSYKNVELAPSRFPEQTWSGILEQYRKTLSSATILFPTQALKTLQQFAERSDGRMLVLAADKGFPYEDQLALCQGPPAIEFHSPDCFSQMVNLDAIGKYFQAIGGAACLPDKHHTGLNLCAFLQGRPGDRFPATESAYRETQSAFGPDDLFTLMAWLNAHMEEMSVAQILSTLRLTRWDTTAFLRLFPVLARQLGSAAAERIDLHDAVMRVWANRYPVTASDKVLAFDCGVVLLELRYFEEAAAMFKESQKVLGPSAATSYNLGLCLQGMGRREEALAFMVEACDLDPKFEPARLSRLKLEQTS